MNAIFVIRYRNQSRRVCRLSLPCADYTPEECEAFAADILNEGHTDVTTAIEERA